MKLNTSGTDIRLEMENAREWDDFNLLRRLLGVDATYGPEFAVVDCGRGVMTSLTAANTTIAKLIETARIRGV